MKTNAIIRIVIWCLVLAILTGVLCNVLYRDRLRYMGSSSATAASPVGIDEVPLQALTNEQELSFPKEINEIEIEWVAGDIVIMAKDVEEITVSESDVSNEDYALLWKQNGNKLEILFCEEKRISVFGIGDTPHLYKDLYICVPMDWEANSLEIDAASANVEMHNISVRELDFDGASGTCDFQNCRIQDLDMDTASGDVYYSGSLTTLDFDAASASFIGDLQNTPSRIDMDSMSGCLDIALPEDCGYSLSMDGMSSRFSSDFYGTSMKNNAHVYGDGRCKINVDGMSCDVTIRKLDTIYLPIVDPTVETVPHCTVPDCTDANCAEHGHTAENCTDSSCTEHNQKDHH